MDTPLPGMLVPRSDMMNTQDKPGVRAKKGATTPYGDVQYADPGLREDKKARYPLDTEEHVRAAWAYINMPRNASKYSPKQLEVVRNRIREAAKHRKIEVSEQAGRRLGAADDMGMMMPKRYMSALTAGAGPLEPPASWFTDPKLTGPTRLSISDDGHITGHLAQWRVCHVGIGNSCVMAPKTRTNYNLFKIGAVKLDDGSEIPIGKIVMGTAHANAQWGVMPARDFYDNTSMTAAIVNVGEDRHGIWINGALTANMTPEKIASLRASALSGDWRTINGNLELIAALAVNSPGFPIFRGSGGSMFSMMGVGVVGQDDETGEFSMADDNSAGDLVAPPTGIEAEQQTRFARLQEITQSWEQDQRAERFAQLAVLDKERDDLAEDNPRAYDSVAIRTEYEGSRVSLIPEPDDDDDAEEDDDNSL